jgi:hypothetical protein
MSAHYSDQKPQDPKKDLNFRAWMKVIEAAAMISFWLFWVCPHPLVITITICALSARGDLGIDTGEVTSASGALARKNHVLSLWASHRKGTKDSIPI